jgi:hypothetical protein
VIGELSCSLRPVCFVLLFRWFIFKRAFVYIPGLEILNDCRYYISEFAILIITIKIIIICASRYAVRVDSSKISANNAAELHNHTGPCAERLSSRLCVGVPAL